MNESIPSEDDAVLSPSTCNNGAIRRAARRMGQIYDEAMAPCGLKSTQYSLLVHIERGKGATMRELADTLIMDLSALGHTLKPLIRDGFVTVATDEHDKRSRRIHLSEDGRDKVREGRKLWKKVHGSFDRIFGEGDAAQLRRALDLVASDAFAQRVAAEMR